MAAARRLAKRAFREADAAFLVEGPQAVRELVADPRELLVELLVTDEAAAQHEELVAAASGRGAPVQAVSGEILARLAQTVTPQGMLAVARRCDVPLAAALRPPPRLAAVLCAVRDPGNAGTVLRAADAAGAGLVAFTDGSVDPYNGKCVRASAGSIFHLPFSSGGTSGEWVAALRDAGLRVLAADGAAPDSLFELPESELAAPTAWLFGNEAWGLPDHVRRLADAAVQVPILGRAESLNLATAAAVCLYASARAQRG